MSKDFSRSWTAELLAAPPLIAPARSFVWPVNIPGEEDALARGALRAMVRPSTGASYLLTCALGFTEPSLPSGIFACPDPDWLCVVAGGYAYLAEASTPERCTLLPLKPVVSVLAAVEAGLLLFVGFTTIVGWRAGGLAWETGRLSWEGVRVESMSEHELRGFGWDLMADKEMEFRVELRTGSFTGGGFRL